MTNFNLPLLHQNQSMKEITINEIVDKITTLMNKVAEKTLTDLPENPTDQTLVLIDERPNEKLLQHANHLAIFKNNSWHFFPPHEGLIIFNMEIKKFMVFKNGNWQKLTEVM